MLAKFASEPTSFTNYSPSNAVFGKLATAEDPEGHIELFLDFKGVMATAATGDFYTGEATLECFIDTGDTITNGDEVNGSALFTTDTTDNDQIAIGGKTGLFQIARGNNKPLGFEARIKTTSVANTISGMFCGLGEANVVATDVPLVDAGTLADTNFIGFHRLEGDGDALDIVYKADGQTQQSFTDAKTIAADTYYKVGFYFDGVETIKFYFDGVEYATARLDATDLDAATFPDDVRLTILFGMNNATTTAAIWEVDYIRCVQKK